MACGINANVYLTQKRQERIDPPLSRPYPCEYPRHEEERPNDKEWDYTDRKSTRLNSSHGYISYAVFCLKKKKRHHVLAAIPVHQSAGATRLYVVEGHLRPVRLLYPAHPEPERLMTVRSSDWVRESVSL